MYIRGRQINFCLHKAGPYRALPSLNARCDDAEDAVAVHVAGVDGGAELDQAVVHFCVHLPPAGHLLWKGVPRCAKGIANFENLGPGALSSEEHGEHDLVDLLASNGVRNCDVYRGLLEEHVAAGGAEQDALKADQLLSRDEAGHESQTHGLRVNRLRAEQSLS